VKSDLRCFVFFENLIELLKIYLQFSRLSSGGDENFFSPSLSVHKTRDVTDDDEDDDDDADEQQQQSALVLVHVHIEIESVDPQKSYHCNQYEEKETDDEEEDRSCCQRR